MGILTCKINSIWDKQLIRNDYTHEEFWVEKNEIPETLHSLLKNTNIKGVWFEGSYADCNEIVYRYSNRYPEETFAYTIN